MHKQLLLDKDVHVPPLIDNKVHELLPHVIGIVKKRPLLNNHMCLLTR